jgi:hypothetical protein
MRAVFAHEPMISKAFKKIVQVYIWYLLISKCKNHVMYRLEVYIDSFKMIIQFKYKTVFSSAFSSWLGSVGKNHKEGP